MSSVNKTGKNLDNQRTFKSGKCVESKLNTRRKMPTEEHKSAFNSFKYEMEKCQTIQTLLPALTDKDKHNFMFCKYFGMN